MAINRDKPTTTKPATPKAEIPANPPVTFSLEAVEKIVNEALGKQAAAFKLAMADIPAKPQAKEGQSEVSHKNDLACIRIFKKAGFENVKPRENVLSFRRWIDLGRRPLEGSKSLKVNGLRLFHVSQTRPLTPEEKQALQAKSDEAVNANKQKIDAVAGKGKAKTGKVVPISEGASPQA